MATVRRRGSSIYDQIGTYDMTTDEVYFEQGVSRRHGYLTEHYVDDPEYIVKVPDGLQDIAVIAEPLSVAEKGSIQAFEIQRRAAQGSRSRRRNHKLAGHAHPSAARHRGVRLQPNPAAISQL
ncbi:MAG: hypothetical protein ACR2IK_11265 [Chloroflexota bacterium]